MARKNILYSFKMLDEADLSGNATSVEVPVATLDQASIVVSWTGAPVGTLLVQAKNGENEAFYDLELGTITIDNTDSLHQIVFNSMPFTHLRLQYVRTSGSGNMDAIITAKQVGG